MFEVDKSCTNINGDDVFNICLKQPDDSFLYMLAGFIQQWINPRTQGICAVAIFLALPYLHFIRTNRKNQNVQVSTYRSAHLVMIHFIHRLCYSLVLDVALYAVFRQHRPCLCNGHQLGSMYGMPSGDAMAGGILAALFIDRNSIPKPISWISGFLIMFAACLERTSLGMHTAGQVLTGTAIAVALHFYSTRVPQYFMFIDAALSFILGWVLLEVDPNLSYYKNDSNNLISWFLWGFAFQVFALLHLWRYSRTAGGKSFLRRSLWSIQREWEDSIVDDDDSSIPINSIDSEYDSDSHFSYSKKNANSPWNLGSGTTTFLVSIAFLLISLLSSLVTFYAWLVRRK